MAISTTTLTGPVYMPNGQTPFGGKVTFEMTSWDQEEGEALIVSGPFVADIDDNGNFSIDLFTTTVGDKSVNYRCYVSWYDSKGAGDYTNQAFNSHGSNNFIKEYIGAFSLSGPGPYQLSELDIVNELEFTGSFDFLTEFKALRLESVTAATDARADALSVNVDKVKLDSIAMERNQQNASAMVTSLNIGEVGIMGGLSYIRDSNGTACSDLNVIGLSPFGEWNIEHFGTDRDAPNRAAAAAFTAFVFKIRVDIDFTEPLSTFENNWNVVFYGKGSFVGGNYESNSYRRQVVPEMAPPAYAKKDRSIALNMPKVGGKIVVFGDSQTTGSANAISQGHNLQGMLESKLKADNPDFDFEMVWLGIGGTRWSDLDGIPSNISQTNYSWYVDLLKEWLSYGEDEQPDVVIFQHGINDRIYFEIADVLSVVSKVNNWSKVPQIVFITNTVPVLDETYGTFDQQESRDQSAGYIRTLARHLGCLCIDLNRTFNLIRDGRDVLEHSLIEQPTITYGSPSHFYADENQQCRSCHYKVKLDSASFYATNPIAFKTGPDTQNIMFLDDHNGYVRVRLYSGGSGSLYAEEILDRTTPTGDSTWEVHVTSVSIGLREVDLPDNNNNASNYAVSFPTYKMGGLFRPRVYYFGTGANETVGPCLEVTLHVGEDRKYIPTATDSMLFGDDDDGADNLDGNDINHYSNFGAMFLLSTHFSANTYPMKEIEEEEAPNYLEIGDLIHAAIDLDDAIPSGSTVDGGRLTICNTNGDLANSTEVVGTTWRCQGRVPATSDAASRITIWTRVA